jgi:hypothetical protein
MKSFHIENATGDKMVKIKEYVTWNFNKGIETMEVSIAVTDKDQLTKKIRMYRDGSLIRETKWATNRGTINLNGKPFSEAMGRLSEKFVEQQKAKGWEFVPDLNLKPK